MGSTFPLVGRAVRLRAFEPGDARALHAYLNDHNLTGRRYIPFTFSWELPLSEQRVGGILARWAEQQNGHTLAVTLQEGAELAGHASIAWEWERLAPSLEIAIAPAHQRQGYGTETARLLLRYLFEYTPANVVTTGYGDWNDQARGFVQHLGFSENGALRRVGLWQGRPVNWVMADLLRREWLEREGGQHGA